MAKFKTSPTNDSMIQVIWLENINGPDWDKVIVSVDESRNALRVIAPDGTEFVFYAGERAPKSMDPEQGYATFPEVQVFMHPEDDELREDPDVKFVLTGGAPTVALSSGLPFQRMQEPGGAYDRTGQPARAGGGDGAPGEVEVQAA